MYGFSISKVIIQTLQSSENAAAAAAVLDIENAKKIKNLLG